MLTYYQVQHSVISIKIYLLSFRRNVVCKMSAIMIWAQSVRVLSTHYHGFSACSLICDNTDIILCTNIHFLWLFSHCILVQLLCHVTVFVAIIGLKFWWKQNHISIEFESWKKNLLWSVCPTDDILSNFEMWGKLWLLLRAERIWSNYNQNLHMPWHVQNSAVMG